MKKRAVFFLIILIIAEVLSSCSKTVPENPIERVDDNISLQDYGADTDMTSVELEEPATEDGAISPEAQAFASVLRNEAVFYCTYNIPYENRDIIHVYREYLKDIIFGDRPLNIQRFSVVDLDSDTTPEVILEMEEYAGFVILRYNQGNIYGNIVGYRSMNCLKENGFFLSASSSDEDSWNRLYFIGDTFIIDGTLSRAGSSYYSEDRCIDESLWWESYDTFDRMTDAEWYDYSDDSIRKWIIENPVFDRTLSEDKEATDERQEYLDSLSYLIEMTYDFTQKTQEERNTSAIAYYQNCREELNTIYQLCLENLSEDVAGKIVVDQQEWEKNFDWRKEKEFGNLQTDIPENSEDQTLYYTLGDMTLRRICYLANFCFSDIKE